MSSDVTMQSQSIEQHVERVNPLHTLARTWAGGIALAWDEVAALVLAPNAILKRGETLEHAIAQQMHHIGQQTRAGSDWMVATLRSPLDWAFGTVHDGSAHAEAELERQVQLALDRMGIPSRDRLLKLGQEIDTLSIRIDAELAHQGM